MVSKNSKKQNPVLFLGLNVEEKNHQVINDIVLDKLSEIQAKYPITDEEINSIKSYIKENTKAKGKLWSFPNTFHVTTLFKGKKDFDKNKVSYQEFEENKGIELKIVGLIYIPLKIITLIVLTNQAVDNKFPHITVLVAEYKPKNSNDVCIALFDDNNHYAKEYKEIKKGKSMVLIDQFNETLIDDKVTGYINIFEPMKLSAHMKGFQR